MKLSIAALIALAAAVSAAPQYPTAPPPPAGAPAPPAPPAASEAPAAPAPPAAGGNNNDARVFTSVEMKAPCGQCLAVGDQVTGGHAIKLAPCDQTPAQRWDVITQGQEARNAFIINQETNECLNFARPQGQQGGRRQVSLEPCDGESRSQFPQGSAEEFPLRGEQVTLEPIVGRGRCVTVNGGQIDQRRCARNDDNQLFTLG